MINSSLAFYILTSLFSNIAECYKYANWENAAFIDVYVLHFMGFFASKVSTFQKFQDLCKEGFFKSEKSSIWKLKSNKALGFDASLASFLQNLFARYPNTPSVELVP